MHTTQADLCHSYNKYLWGFWFLFLLLFTQKNNFGPFFLFEMLPCYTYTFKFDSLTGCEVVRKAESRRPNQEDRKIKKTSGQIISIRGFHVAKRIHNTEGWQMVKAKIPKLLQIAPNLVVNNLWTCVVYMIKCGNNKCHGGVQKGASLQWSESSFKIPFDGTGPLACLSLFPVAGVG